jgi:hypothetical protein
VRSICLRSPFQDEAHTTSSSQTRVFGTVSAPSAEILTLVEAPQVLSAGLADIPIASVPRVEHPRILAVVRAPSGEYDNLVYEV